MHEALPSPPCIHHPSPVTDLTEAFARIDQANAEDPNLDAGQPKERLYGQRMSAHLDSFEPEASVPLRLAARAQHLRRWQIPRSDFPEGRKGYLQWRTRLYRYHAEQAQALLADLFEAPTLERMASLLLKRDLHRDAEMQALEDVICLVFLEHYWADFAPKHSEEKLISIVQKTWKKMTPKGHEAALKLPFDEGTQALLAKALS